MDEIPLCPNWWPHMLWHLHFPFPGLVPHIPDPVSPINYPPVINELLLSLVRYSASYHVADERAALDMRVAAKAEVVDAANKLHVEDRRG